LQHENELLQQKVTNLETLLQTERGITSELRRDKETTQKQLELVTLRLPAPKVGFWSRIFGGGGKKDECEILSSLTPTNYVTTKACHS